jgi:hypothetical protein
MTAGVVTHSASLALYMFVLAYVARTVPLLDRIRHRALRRMARSFLVLLTTLALTFSVIQVTWIGQNHQAELTPPIDWLWLLFDWANAAAYIAMVAVIKTYAQWIPASVDYPGDLRRNTDHTPAGY